MKATLILENGQRFHGKAFGHVKETVGEVVFNTGMTGYQEILTDPSYTGQIVTMTYPLIGNYGINLGDMESANPKVKGFIVRELTEAQIHNKFDSFHNTNAVEEVTTKETYEIAGEGKHIAVLDFGVKENILCSLQKRDCKLTVFPAFTPIAEILKVNPDGILLSNGPGDPKDLSPVIETIKGLLGVKPIFGICLGHQLLTLSLGGDTERLKFGHRGCNHPVKDLINNRVYITSQNHGYVVNGKKLPQEVSVTHINMNDQTIEGIAHKTLPAFSVQFHPEAAPGPRENDYLFDRFMKMMEEEEICQEIRA